MSENDHEQPIKFHKCQVNLKLAILDEKKNNSRRLYNIHVCRYGAH